MTDVWPSDVISSKSCNGEHVLWKSVPFAANCCCHSVAPYHVGACEQHITRNALCLGAAC